MTAETVSDPVSSQVQLYLETLKAPKLCLKQPHAPFINQNPLAMLPTYFYVDEMFCHFGKCKQITKPFSPSSLVIGKKVQDERERKCV